MGHPLIHGVNPKLKRLRVPPFGCRLGIPLVSRVAPSLPYRADHIPLPGRVRRRRHYASGQTMGVLFTTLCVSFYARLHTSSVGMFVLVLFHNLHPPSSALFIFFLGTILSYDTLSITTNGGSSSLVKYMLSRTRFLTFQPRFPAPPQNISLFNSRQLGKQNDKDSARDMSGYKPANFDSSFKAGRGWGSMGVRTGHVADAQLHTTHSLSTTLLLLMFFPFLFNRRRGEVAIDSFDLHVRMTPVVVTAGGN